MKQGSPNPATWPSSEETPTHREFTGDERAGAQAPRQLFTQPQVDLNSRSLLSSGAFVTTGHLTQPQFPHPKQGWY